MYGTIAKLRAKEGVDLEELARQRTEFDRHSTPGYVGHLVFRADTDPLEHWMVVLFDDRESYHANAQRPETHEQYLVMQKSLDGEPEWHDGEIVETDLSVSRSG
jgi:hypothetical protein